MPTLREREMESEYALVIGITIEDWEYLARIESYLG